MRRCVLVAMLVLAPVLIASSAQALVANGTVSEFGSTLEAPTRAPALHARLLLIPEPRGVLLRDGLALRLSLSARADAIAWISIPRGEAELAGFKAARQAATVIAAGTVSGLSEGTTSLRLKLSRFVANKLRSLSQLAMTVRMSVVGVGGSQVWLDARGRY
jgi:hypothetical protein